MSTFKDSLDKIGWSLTEAASRLDCNRRTVERWYSGANTCPPEVEDWARRVALAIGKVAHPIGWRRREGERA